MNNLPGKFDSFFQKISSLSQNKLLLLIVFLLFFFIFLLGAIYFFGMRGESSVKVGLGEYVTLENVRTYASPDENSYRGYLIPGRTFEIVEMKEDWAKIYVRELNQENNWEGWVKVSSTEYEPKQQQ